MPEHFGMEGERGNYHEHALNMSLLETIRGGNSLEQIDELVAPYNQSLEELMREIEGK